MISKETMMEFLTNNGFVYLGAMTFVAYAVTGIGMLMVPTIADSIVSVGGATVMSRMKRAATSGSRGAMAGAKAGMVGAKVAKDFGKNLWNKLPG